MPSIRELIGDCRVMPVLVIEHLADAVPLADALVAGGARAVEVTLRTPCALDAICAIRKAHEQLVIGAGTVLKPQDFTDSGIAGAQFYVSPGASASLLDAARTGNLPWMPGIATVSEAMQMAEFGFDCLKLFPALVSGGVAMLKALNGPLPHLRFCPTGGITAVNVHDYLAQPNVICVGGSWIADAKHMKAQDWRGIESAMRVALSS